ncbi:aminotransferase class III-fold pyridoxal phosphate-dependent enzyme [Arthrobacter sp. AK01]|uniref:aspartate aminotransferase family protein n=1 Tax=Micrococcaceae TaxID=1268 RepID=UPI001E485EC5|nr:MULTISPECIES: aminotransferase class III-fold pyridoxal phosphate-dependent enzyme [Micrococcaceae]MCD4853126.1 aminotransferase class III-fold pyridoxal phosphate-dependent enzyme [Arthrobacter sp. AK01]MCP1413700.1 glutamate-1-semialdehyde 2,1-aminomutase [Paenarthrobacter sp. A20]
MAGVQMSTNSGLFREALQFLPGGNTRSTLFVPPSAPYAAYGDGARITDVDGHKVIDCNNNYTSLIHGHKFRPVLDKVHEIVEHGTSFGLPTESEIRLAEELSKRLPAAEQWRFVNSGTEAVMHAMRIARAHTNRDVIVRFVGSYHGTSDAVVDLNMPGIPRSVADSVVTMPIGDAWQFKAFMRERGRDVAAVLIDLMPNRAGLQPANDSFVSLVREETKLHDALLIIDEVITFRSSFGGLQGVYEVEPDLTTLGKVIGGGFPVGAVGGKPAVMDVTNPALPGTIAWGGTFSANPVTMNAGLVALDYFQQHDITKLNAKGDALREAFLQAGIQCNGFGSLIRIFPADMTTTWWKAYREGVLLGTSGLIALSTAMDEGVIEEILQCVIRISQQ